MTERDVEADQESDQEEEKMAEAAMAEEQAWINLARVTHLHCYYLLLPDQEVPVTSVAPHAYWNHVPKHPFQLP